jgi:hypothetical protein
VFAELPREAREAVSVYRTRTPNKPRTIKSTLPVASECEGQDGLDRQLKPPLQFHVQRHEHGKSQRCIWGIDVSERAHARSALPLAPPCKLVHNSTRKHANRIPGTSARAAGPMAMSLECEIGDFFLSHILRLQDRFCFAQIPATREQTP